MIRLLIVPFLFCCGFIQVAAQNFTSSNLPVIIINTNGQTIPDDPKITADMGIVYNGAGVRNNLTDPKNHYNGKIGIEIRGKSSQMFPMKSYSIELRDAAGSSVNKSLLGMPSESDWVLYAPYTDKALMRNFLAYTMGREMGRWAPRTQFVEVILNNDYVGVYVLLEKIKRGSGRVNIAKLNATDIAGDAVTGGYIFAIDKTDPGDEGWSSRIPPLSAVNGQRIDFLYNVPKTSAIVNEQRAYIKSYVDSFETALNSFDFQDPVYGFRRYADVNSFIDYFIINEVSRNVDGYRLSTYLNKDRQSRGGKLNAGPIWDYDLAFRNADYCSGSNVSGWSYQFNSLCNKDFWLVPFWWDRFMQDTAYTASLRCRWKQLRQKSLSNNRINFLVDSVNTLLGEAQQRHFQRWPVLGQYIWPNPQPIPTSYAGEISTLKQWLSDRLTWIDINVPNTGACRDWPIDAVGTMIINIYPNPVSDAGITATLQSKNNQPVSLQVTDAAGRIIYIKQINAIAGINTFSDLNPLKWQKGMYTFCFKNADGEKIVKQIVKQ
jgi:CotH kinase protein/Secretion system C-terminal sorting domain